MKAAGGNYSFHMPAALVAEVEAVADEEHRAVDDLVSEAVKLYLEQRPHRQLAPRKNLAQFLKESPFAGAELHLGRRKEYLRPPEL